MLHVGVIPSPIIGCFLSTNLVYTPLSCSLVVCICELPVCGLVGELPGGRAGQEWRRDDLCCCGGSRSHGTHGPTTSGKESTSVKTVAVDDVFREWTPLTVVSTLPLQGLAILDHLVHNKPFNATKWF